MIWEELPQGVSRETLQRAWSIFTIRTKAHSVYNWTIPTRIYNQNKPNSNNIL